MSHTQPRTVARAALAVLTALALVSCAVSDDGPADGSRRLVATDGSFSVDVPDNWVRLDVSDLGDVVVVAAKGPNGLDQLFVTRHEGEGGATEHGLWVSAGLAGSGVICTRIEATYAFGDPRTAFDCPQAVEGTTVRRVLVPHVLEDGTSLLVFTQTIGESLRDTADVVRPILDSIRERDDAGEGTGLRGLGAPS